MIVSDLLARLSYGPLSNLSIGQDGAGTIDPSKVPVVIQYANDCIQKLFTKFVLIEKQLIIQQSETQTTYKINVANTVSSGAVGAYILDTMDNPYTDDLIKILGVFDQYGHEIHMNDEGSHYSVFTPRVDTLQVPEPKDGEPLFLIYQAKHPKLDPSVTTTTIDIPSILEQALVNYVASEVFSNMNGQENLVKAKDLMDKYTITCGEVLQEDLVNSSVSQTSKKFHERGFR